MDICKQHMAFFEQSGFLLCIYSAAFKKSLGMPQTVYPWIIHATVSQFLISKNSAVINTAPETVLVDTALAHMQLFLYIVFLQEGLLVPTF